MNFYKSKWFPRVFFKRSDGGKNSGVTGYMLIEWKKFFSIGLLHFKKGSREAYHSHAFNAVTWWLKGNVTEERIIKINDPKIKKDFSASLRPKITKRDNLHKIISHCDTWALTFRGPWVDYWDEVKAAEGRITLTHGRKVV